MAKTNQTKEIIPVEEIKIPVKKYREDTVDYINEGTVKGVLAREPQLVHDTLLVLTVLVRDDQPRPLPGSGKRQRERRKLYHFPTFTVFGKRAAVYAKHLHRGQVVQLTYKLETRKVPDKNQPGKDIYYSGQVIIDLKAGKVLEGDELPYILDK